MKMSESQRLMLRNRLVELLGEPEATTLMDSMPPIDHDALATRDDFDRGLAAVRTDLGHAIDSLGTDVDARFAQVDARFVAITAELRGDMAELRGEMAELRGDLRMDMANMTRTLVATQIATMLGVVGLVLGLG